MKRVKCLFLPNMNSGKHRFSILIFWILIFCQGCGILPLAPAHRDQDDMQVTWDDQDDKPLIVRHKRKDKTTTEKGTPAKLPVDVLRLDTVSMALRPLFTEVNSWMGTPYGYGQKEKIKGTDCSGFTQEIYRTVYKTALARSAEAQAAETQEIKKEELQSGDLVFFRIQGSRISHVGLYLGNQKFVHATVGAGVMVNDLNEKYYAERYARGGRVIKAP